MIYAAARTEVSEEEIVALFEEALAALGEGDSRARAQALQAYGMARGGAGHPAEARRHLSEAADVSRRRDDRDVLAGALAATIIQTAFEDPDHAVKAYAELEALGSDDASVGEETLGIPPLLMAGFPCVAALRSLGRTEEAEVLSLRVQEIPMGGLDPILMMIRHYGLANRLMALGDLAGSLREARLCLDEAQRQTNQGGRAIGHNALALACWRAGRLEEAEEHLNGSIESGLERRANAAIGVNGLAWLSQLRLERGDRAGARAAAERGLEFAVSRGLVAGEVHNRLALARLLLAERPSDWAGRARAEIDRAEEQARSRGHLGEVARVEELRDELAQAEGDAAGSERARNEAARLHRLCGDEWAADHVLSAK
jgi:tetratricopeptide (TPR) repeat protein